MMIIGLLAGLVVPQFIKQEEKATAKAARAQIELLRHGARYLSPRCRPLSDQPGRTPGLIRSPAAVDRWDGPYLKKDVPPDPWGKPYIYKSPGDHGPYDIISYGADGVPGGDDNNHDVTSWER